MRRQSAVCLNAFMFRPKAVCFFALFSGFMCGIAGFVGRGDQEILKKMTDSIRHRGPDDEGFLFLSTNYEYTTNSRIDTKDTKDTNIGLGFRRLSIIDLSTGHQPIFNEDKTIAIVFNGEIYNYLELKKDLEPRHKFYTNTDTEVIVHLYEELGERVFEKLNGMFAMAIWDSRNKKLILARDRLGKKPLYWTKNNEALVFGSELKALLAHPSVEREIDKSSLQKYFLYEYIPTPGTIFKNINRLEPGHFLVLENGKTRDEAFWDVSFGHSELSFNEALSELDARLSGAVQRRLMSDVPLGIFLSGGLDSSTIAYYAQKNSAQKIKTFSIGFREKSYDESAYARMAAAALGTEHHEKILEAREALDLIPRIADFLDEPMSDYSVIPTYLLSRFTREHVTVALGGDGGDELLMGYPTFLAHRLAGVYQKHFRGLGLGALTAAAGLLPASFGDYTFEYKLKRFLSGLSEPLPIRQEMWLAAYSPDEIGQLFSDGAMPKDALLSGTMAHYNRVAGESNDNQAIYLYLKQYLQDEILVKVDRASMASSLEVRAPFLDYTLVDFISSLPSKYKLHNLTPKFILKKLMAGKLPAEIINRKKKGFGVPLAMWLKDDLRGFMIDLLSREKINREGFFRYPYIESLIKDHLSGRVDNRKKLWPLLVFEMWFDRWAKKD